MGKNKGGRDMASSAHDMVDKAKRDGGQMLDSIDESIDDVKGFNDRAKAKVENLNERGREAMHRMEDKAKNAADKVDSDIAGKANERMKNRRS